MHMFVLSCFGSKQMMYFQENKAIHQTEENCEPCYLKIRAYNQGPVVRN